MERSTLFYVIFGAAVVLVPALTDRLLKDRVPEWQRFVLGTLAAVATGVVLVLAARPLGL